MQPHEPPARAIRRILTEQVDEALQHLQKSDQQPDRAVHETRKSYKRIRAVLRLVRDDIGNKAYKRENIFFRDLGRASAETRDSLVIIRTLDSLMARHEEHLKVRVAKDVRKHFEEQHAAQLAGLEADTEHIEQAVEALEAARERISHIILEHEGFGAFKSGLKKIYGDGRDGWHDAYKKGSAEVFHEWRKDVKYLWHQLEVLTPIWEAVVGEHADELHKLATMLGDEHDLVVLREALQQLPPDVAEAEAVLLLTTVIDGERERLHKLAKPLAKRLYADKPKAFARRLDAYWHAWERENEHEAAESLITSS